MGSYSDDSTYTMSMICKTIS